MDNSLPETPESPHETTESFKNAAKQVVKGLGLTFVTDKPTANSESTTPQSSRNDEEYDAFKKNMRNQMASQGISEQAIAQAEKFSDLQRQFVQEALKIKRENFPQASLSIQPSSSEELEKHHKNAEQTIAEMLKMRQQSVQPSNNNTDKNKPD